MIELKLTDTQATELFDYLLDHECRHMEENPVIGEIIDMLSEDETDEEDPK